MVLSRPSAAVPSVPFGRPRRSLPVLLAVAAGVAAFAATLAGPAGAESRYDSTPQTPPRAGAVDGFGRPVPLTGGPVFFLTDDLWIDLTPSRSGLPEVPLACLALVPVRHGAVRLVEAQCLWEAGLDTRALPAVCAVSVHVEGGPIQGFDPTCLGAAGYRLAGR